MTYKLPRNHAQDWPEIPHIKPLPTDADIERLKAERDRLRKALLAAMPQLEWANIHGSRCEELLRQCAQALAEGEHRV